MGLFIQCAISGSFTFLGEGVVIISFVLTCLSELLALLCTQRGCLVDDLICIAVHIKSYCHPPCVPNHISKYGLLKECFELNVGSYHWEISCISALQSLWIFLPLPLTSLEHVIAIFSVLERRQNSQVCSLKTVLPFDTFSLF